ncbi:MAG: hypothetical protein IAB19_06650 [Proteobacteria bacterium]|uniref:Uncharacterized protein n=1 Tax=Candidatus Avisuccinivibrio stercorigallinarum TaxID=2840704 RepID=A0A9D9DCM6_9GAMM|nr:hypothetical protein [Candidatus Avisuccinivibrio stercorigallinarum]
MSTENKADHTAENAAEKAAEQAAEQSAPSKDKERPLADWDFDDRIERQAIKTLHQISGEKAQQQFTSFRTDGTGPSVPAAQAVSPDLPSADDCKSSDAEQQKKTDRSYRDSMPKELRDKLTAIDEENMSGEADGAERAQAALQAQIEQGGSRFYHKAQALMDEGKAKGRSFKANWRIYAAVALLFAAYYAYNEYFKPQGGDDLFSLNFPVMIDPYTDLVSAEDLGDEVLLTISKDPEGLGAGSVSERDQILDKIEQNAPALCKNPQFYQIIASGKKLTVLLQGSDGSFERRYTLTQCPLQAAQTE